MTNEVRAGIWAIIFQSLQAKTYLNRAMYRSRISNWEQILKNYWVKIEHKFLDEFNDKPEYLISYAKNILGKPYTEVLEFVEFLIQHKDCPSYIEDNLNGLFKKTGFAYRLIEQTVTPIANEMMASAVIQSTQSLSGYEAALTHLKASAALLTRGAYADSVRESIHAVESVARKITPTANTLGPALNEFDNKFGLHPALKKGFIALYGYSSDEAGVRHALVDDIEANVSEEEALYMFGSCASFASLLSALARKSTDIAS
jgi:AbiJ N-terminal domain 4